MKLSRVPILRETIDVREEVSFEVRGINVSDLLVIMHSHAPVIMVMWRKLQDDDKDLLTSDVRALFNKVALEFPDIMAAIIALAADDNNEEGRTIARQLPVDVQISAIETIFRLSFQSESALEKLASLAVTVIQGITRAMQTAQIQSANTFGDSAAA